LIFPKSLFASEGFAKLNGRDLRDIRDLRDKRDWDRDLRDRDISEMGFCSFKKNIYIFSKDQYK
jgi:hypothetical protein